MKHGDCTKKQFRSRAAAEVALAGCINSSVVNEDRRERRIYRCRKCGCWHLTSQIKK